MDQVSISALMNGIIAEKRLGQHVICTLTIRLPWLDK